VLGDPKQCCLHALRCAELAATAQTRHLKATFLELSHNWTRLAESLERTQALLYEYDVEFDKLVRSSFPGRFILPPSR
jgi:hypothetical protein